MPHKGVAIVAAMRRELAPLLRGSRGRQVDGMELFELDGAVIAIGGVGRNAARHASEALVDAYSPEVLISAGTAGALTAKLKAGDVVEAKQVIDVDSGTCFKTSKGDSVIATVSSVEGPAEKQLLVERWKADVVEMEAAAVAEVAHRRGVGFAALKAVSDELNFVMPPLGKFVGRNGNFEMLRFVIYIAVRPKWWGAVRQLNSNSRLAAANLSDSLKHLIDQRSIASEEKVSEA
jgi:adenosylhomocysteine nucleosidase